MATYTIMIVEDDPEIRSELPILLENEMYHPFPVTDFRTIPEQTKQICPNLILLDIDLPDRMASLFVRLCAGQFPPPP